MVAVPENIVEIILVTVALLAGPAALSPAGATLETQEPEPECYPADDGTGAYICEFPDDCADLPDCEAPPQCELIDDNVVRCQPSNGTSNDSNESRSSTLTTSVSVSTDVDLIRPEDDVERLSQPAADCRLDAETKELVCQPSDACRNRSATPSCRVPSDCEAEGEDRYRCPASSGQEPPARNGSANGSHQDDGNASSGAHASGPRCQPGPERGTLVCEPPAGCEDRMNETERCTPPSECEPRGDGSYRCQVPDRGQAPSNTSGEDPFAADPEVRAQARADVAASLGNAADMFRENLTSMRADYEAQMDELRAEYEQGKAELKADYEDCRAQIPDDVDASERSEGLRSCIQDAREGLSALKANLTARHDKLKATFEDRIEQVRQHACQQAEQAALDAIARRGLFNANPGELVPERALDLCPAFADFGDGGGEA